MTTRDLHHGARSILQAATELFALEGFESVSVGAIAERAGVSKANVFHHFASKEELILAVMEEVSDSHVQFAEALLEEEGPCADKVRRLIQFEIIDMFANRSEMRLIVREIVDHARGTVRDMAQKIFQRNYRATVALFEQGQARGEFRRDFDPAAAALMLNGASHLFFQSSEMLQRVSAAKRARSAEAYAEQIFGLLLGGVMAEPNKPDATQARPARQKVRQKTQAAKVQSVKVQLKEKVSL